MNSNILKSIGAVFAGFLVIVVLSIGTDAILKAIGVLPYDHMFVSAGLILAVIIYRAIYSLIGCYLTARLAPRNPMKHALALGVVGLIISIIGAVAAADLGPAWYGWTLVVIALPIAWLGGKLYESHSEQIDTNLKTPIYTRHIVRSSNTEAMKLRKAEPDDLKLLNHWDEQPHVIAAAPNDDWEWETELQQNHDWRELLIAELNGCPVGFIQIIDPALEETHYWGDIGDGYRAIDIWIGEKEDLGKSYGTTMMKMAIERCFSDPEIRAIWIDPLESNTKAHRFYERLGFMFIERRRFGEDDCLVYRLDRADWNQNPK